jgi:hypothetical protein
MRNYFQLANSLYGEVYFRVSKHLGILPSEVMKKKFTLDIRFLIMKYTQQILTEIEQSKKIKEQSEQ